MRCRFSLLFFYFGRFFHLGRAAAENAGYVHFFKARCIGFRSPALCFFHGGGLFGSFNFFHFFHHWRRFAPMENGWRFHAGLSLFLLLKLARNRPGGFGILQETMLLLLRFGNGCFRPRGLGRALRRPFFAILGQRLARKHHRPGGKCRRIDGVLGRRLGTRRGFGPHRRLRSPCGRLRSLRLVFGNRFARQQDWLRALFKSVLRAAFLTLRTIVARFRAAFMPIIARFGPALRPRFATLVGRCFC